MRISTITATSVAASVWNATGRTLSNESLLATAAALAVVQADTDDIQVKVGTLQTGQTSQGTGALATAALLATAQTAISDIQTKVNALTTAVAAIPTTPINSVQRGTISLGAGTLSGTATITSVNMAKSFISTGLHQFGPSNVAEPVSYHPMVVLTNATTVTASRQDSSQGVVVPWQVIEYK